MWRRIAIGLSLLALVVSGRVVADDKSVDQARELARLAGEYAAEFSQRTDHAPAEQQALRELSLKVSGDVWTQSFRGDVATYTIVLDRVDDVRTLRLTHKKVKAVRHATYVLDGDTLTVTEPIGDGEETIVTVWRRKPVE